jgi:hypothetical protein
MLALCQKPEGAFKAPTYILGGSDCSRTRQGGLLYSLIMIMKLMSVVTVLLAYTVKRTHREKKGYGPVLTGIFIHASVNLFSSRPVLLLPEVLPTP